MQFFMPTRLITGKDVVVNNAELIAKCGKKALIVTGANSAKKCGALDDVVKALESQGIEYRIYDKVCQNPRMKDCLEAVDMAKGFGADFIIGIGGGSPMDSAKIIAKRTAQPTLPIVLVGTTAGTGSEVTKVAIITNDEGFKKSEKTDDMYATLAFGDPKYTATLSREFTISTAIDALAHCVESYFSHKATPISRAFSIKGSTILMKQLKKLKEGQELTEADREEIYDASILGGLAIAVTGTAFPHNVGYYLTETHHIPHGIACAVFMPDMLYMVRREHPEYVEEFMRAVGVDFDTFVENVKTLLPKLDIRVSKEAIEEQLPRWENNGSVQNSYCKVSTEDIRRILAEKYQK